MIETISIPEIRSQLVDRKERLEKAISETGNVRNLINLLHDVDHALERMDNGSYGLCEICNGPIEREALLANPLLTVCLEDLNSSQQKMLEQDLDLASRIQKGLLPKNNLKVDGWEISYYYSPAGPVSGDYCDIIIDPAGAKPLLFCFGDVSGKGIAASLLMSHMQAMFHSLSSFDLPLEEIMIRANRLFCESTLSTHYATLIGGKADRNGMIEIVNAGHNPPILLSGNSVNKIKATDMPVGLFCNSEYSTQKVKLNSDDVIVFYTDGLTESFYDQSEYGEERLLSVVNKLKNRNPQSVIEEILTDLNLFLSGNKILDDLTIMVVKRA